MSSSKNINSPHKLETGSDWIGVYIIVGLGDEPSHKLRSRQEVVAILDSPDNKLDRHQVGDRMNMINIMRGLPEIASRWTRLKVRIEWWLASSSKWCESFTALMEADPQSLNDLAA